MSDPHDEIPIDHEHEQPPLSEEELKLIGDLGNEFDDPEGWWTERVDYWMQLPDATPPSAFLLRWSRIRVALGSLRQWVTQKGIDSRSCSPTREEWIKLFEDEVGPLRDSLEEVNHG